MSRSALDDGPDAAAPPDAGPLQPRGSSQGGLRQYNERVVLQVVRLHGALPSADIARLTGLTPQTISLITKRLTDDGLLQRGEPRRGKVGQPSVPLSLNPDGALSIGIKVGRRSLDTLLVDFLGRPRKRWSLDYRQADPDQVLTEIARRLDSVQRSLGPDLRSRLQGVGVAAPLSMGGWQQLLGFQAEVAARWRDIDLRAEVARRTPLPVTLVKDTAAACVAELVAGRGRSLRSFLYVFVDTFIGGGLVLDSQLHAGPSGNAGAIGSMPLWIARGANDPPPAQLLGVASLLGLEQRYGSQGLDASAASDARALQPPWLALTEPWLESSAAAIAQCINSAACLLDLEGVIIDGSFDRALLEALMQALQPALDRYNWEGVSRPAMLPGAIGPDARALGGALLPLYAAFSPDRELFLKAVDPG